MTTPIRIVSSIAVACLLSCLPSANAQTESPRTSFKVTVEQPADGRITIRPAIPADGKVLAGTILTVSVAPAEGYALDSGYCTILGPWGRAYQEFFTPEFQVPVDHDRAIGASLIDKKALEGFTVTQDVLYAQPGIKKLKYDVYSPNGAKNLPCIIIIHGGGWVV